MNSAEKLVTMDRCPRAAFWSQSWEAPAVHPNEVLRRAIDAGLMCSAEDPGQYAGDTVMTLAAERTLDVSGSQYSCALHNAALADVIVTVLRGNRGPWGRPVDSMARNLIWESNCFLEATGLRLRRVVIVDRWSEERFAAETHSWKGLGEVSRYEMPMTMSVVVIGQRRDVRHHSPWSKGWLHPRSRTLRIRKRSGEGFGGDWKECWREQSDFSRDKWIDQMQEDGALHDVLFEKHIEVPEKAVMVKINALAERKLERLVGFTEVPEPNPSMCDWPVPCQFRKCCWNFTTPSERGGFVPVAALSIS